MVWSLQEYCALQSQHLETEGWDASALGFLGRMNLTSMHPFCNHFQGDADFAFPLGGVPPMGALEDRFEDETLLERLVTLAYMIVPPFWAMTELWLRLLSGMIGPMAIIYLLVDEYHVSGTTPDMKERTSSVGSTSQRFVATLFAVVSCLILMTDTAYVQENGPVYGLAMFIVSVVLAMRASARYEWTRMPVFLWALILLAVHLVWDGKTNTISFGDQVELTTLSEGLYYDSSNPFVQTLVSNWPEEFRTYTAAQGATVWQQTGDARTGLPFLLNHIPSPDWNRVFMPTSDGEYVALDFSFPTSKEDGVTPQFDEKKPVYFVLHGLNGGSDEMYVRDLTHRVHEEGSTVVVMVARGLMDLPVRGWDMFHGARTSDAHEAAMKVRSVLAPNQPLIGVGYSMGAIVLTNYVASYGSECALDGVIPISGGLDTRYNGDFYRAQRLWQPMLAETLRGQFLLGKWGHRVHDRLSTEDMKGLLRASHVTEVDHHAIVPYNGFRDLDDYYASMSALGDIPHREDGYLEMNNKGKIHSVALPMCVVHAFDDPLVTWRSTVQEEGFMKPDNLVKSGSGNLMILMTNAGGHVGWPVGMLPHKHKWEWMSNVAISFGKAVATTMELKDEVNVSKANVNVEGKIPLGSKDYEANGEL